MLKKYKNLNNNSTVDKYEIGDHYIKVKFFNKPRIYTYSYNSAGKNHVENMKELAKSGVGLN